MKTFFTSLRLKLPLLSSAMLLLALLTVANAAEDTTTIGLDLTHTEYVSFIGSSDNASRFFDVTDVEPVGNRRRGPRVLIGTLGLESNVTGNCDLDFSTQNNFRLRHTVTNRRLTNYRLRYRNTNITRNRNRQMTVPCNYTPSNFQFQSVGNFRNNVQTGIYRDVIMITVTTQ